MSGPPTSFKIVILGDSGVGKTAIISRLTDGYFDEDMTSTVGVEYRTHDIDTTVGTVRLNIWDTAGQEKFRSVVRSYFRNSVAAVLCFDCNNRKSFDGLDTWLNDLHTFGSPNAIVLLVSNKIDIAAERTVTQAEAEDFAKRHGIEYLETSAKDGSNIEEVFIRLAQSIVDAVNEGNIRAPANFGKKQEPEAAVTQKPASRCPC